MKQMFFRRKIVSLHIVSDHYYTDEDLTSFKDILNFIFNRNGSDDRAIPTVEDDDTRWDYVPYTPSSRTQGTMDYDANAYADYPEDIHHLMKMAKLSRWALNASKAFYEQAAFMAGYTDDAPIVPYQSFYPKFSAMTPEQMRSYFTVRALLRKGIHPDVTSAYLLLYCYETLMQIGIASPEEGYEILSELQDAYPGLNGLQATPLKQWLCDYVVWYGLQEHYDECFASKNEQHKQAQALDNYQNIPDEEFFHLLDDLSNHCVSNGALYKRQQATAINAIAGVMRRLIPTIRKRYHRPLSILCYGKTEWHYHMMFEGALFYSPQPIQEAMVEVAPGCAYSCHLGQWQVTRLKSKSSLDGKVMRTLLHNMETMVRQSLGFKPAMKLKYADEKVAKVSQGLEQAVADWHAEWLSKDAEHQEQRRREEAERKERERREAIERARASVSIDMDKLNSIRKDAAAVRDQLIVEEEETEQPATILPVSQPATATPAPTPQVSTPAPKVQDSTADSSSHEAAFIKLLLAGGDWRAYLRSIHTPQGVMVENINAKAMDDIGDIVLEDDGTDIHVIDDYREDITNLFK